MWSLISSHAKRISGPEKFRALPQKDFCNNIGTERTCQPYRRMSALRGKPEVNVGKIDFRF
jgi:hypothetical protein